MDDLLKEVKHIIIQFVNVEYTIPNKEHVDVILTSLLPKYYIVVQSIVACEFHSSFVDLETKLLKEETRLINFQQHENNLKKL